MPDTTPQPHIADVENTDMPQHETLSHLTTADLLALMARYRREANEATAAANAAKEQFNIVECELICRLDVGGMSSATARHNGRRITGSITEIIVPSIEDWDLFCRYARENDAMHLLQRRIASGSFREMIQAGQQVPGLVPFTKRQISLTSR